MTVERLVQLRGGLSPTWQNSNPILALGEMGLELDTRKMKVGDGITDWNDLPYFNNSASVDLSGYQEKNSTTGIVATQDNYSITVNSIKAELNNGIGQSIGVDGTGYVVSDITSFRNKIGLGTGNSPTFAGLNATGTVTAGNGSITTAGYGFASETNTGVYLTGTGGNLNLVLRGTVLGEFMGLGQFRTPRILLGGFSANETDISLSRKSGNLMQVGDGGSNALGSIECRNVTVGNNITASGWSSAASTATVDADLPGFRFDGNNTRAIRYINTGTWGNSFAFVQGNSYPLNLIQATNGFVTGSGTGFKWTAGINTPYNSIDTQLTRLSAGVVQVGTTANNDLGTIQAARFNIGTNFGYFHTGASETFFSSTTGNHRFVFNTSRVAIENAAAKLAVGPFPYTVGFGYSSSGVAEINDGQTTGTFADLKLKSLVTSSSISVGGPSSTYATIFGTAEFRAASLALGFGFTTGPGLALGNGSGVTFYSGIGQNGPIMAPGGYLGWTDGTLAQNFNTTLSRPSGGVLQIGSGTGVNALGALACNNINVGSSGINFGGAFTVSNNSGAFYVNQSIWALNRIVIGYGNGTNAITWNDTTWLYQDAANTLGQRNGANAQRYNLYGTYSDTSNLRRMYFSSTTAGDFRIGCEGLGTGATGNTLTIENATAGTAISLINNLVTSIHSGGTCVSRDDGFIVNTFRGYSFSANTANNPTTGELRINRFDSNTLHIGNRLNTETRDLKLRNLIAEGTLTSTVQDLSTDPVMGTDLTAGQTRIIKNTSTGVVKGWVNDGGTPKSVTYS